MTDNFYRAFEERYRGSRELIKSRLRVYLPFVEPLKALCADCAVIDLGCGRGEWLELMGEAGFSARGVDLDDGMLAACVELGLTAERGDLIAYLRSLPDASVVVVSGFHVVEHIAFEALQQLVQEALRVLKPAGLLILETPNPENLSVGASSFYLDPTHVTPIPPALLSFLPEHYRFTRTKVLRLQESPGLAAATEIGLNDVLLGVSPDYAVLAQKGSNEPAEMAFFDAAFATDFGVDLNTLATRYDAQVGSKFEEILTRVDRSSALDGEIERLQAHIAWQQGEWDGAKGELAQARADVAARDGEIERLHAHIAWQQGGWDGVKAELSPTQAQLAAMYASTSWRVSAPLRAIAIGTRSLRTVPARAKLAVKIWLKPQVVHAGAYLSARPSLKASVQRALGLIPGLHARLARAAQPAPEIATQAAPEQGATYANVADLTPSAEQGGICIGIDELTASARRVYQDLLDARAAEAPTGGKA